jgi:hypothetical protein
MRKIRLLLFVNMLFFRSHFLMAQTGQYADTAAVYFDELKAATKKHEHLWNYDLYAPVLLVNPTTRELFANMPDTAGILKNNGKIYSGVLPKTVNISNTSVQWSGQNWAMVMLPLSQNKNTRINLLTHELFHRAQRSLGFFAYNPDNTHLDKKDGRIYLRLELEALKKAVKASSENEVKENISDALAFRAFRYSQYPGADSTENLMELNEGICEFTGLMMSGRSKGQMKEYFIKRIDYFISSPSYLRSFAYETTPVYGYLLSAIKKDWNKKIKGKINLSNYFKKEFGISLPADLKKQVNAVTNKYRGDIIIKEEITRDIKNKKQIAEYQNKLIDSPHVELPLLNMNMSFDYTKMVSLDKQGTVYPQIRITDNWGILEVEQGALISANWNQVNISFPITIQGNKINGEGWKLELKEGYKLEKDELDKNYILKNK